MSIINIVELAEGYGLKPKRQGDILVCFCPFHKDMRRPNFTLYPSTNSYFCFSCSKGGDAIDFYASMEGISRRQATSKLLDDMQLLLDKINFEPKEKPFNGIIDLQLSKQFRDFLYKYSDKVVDILNIMKDIDEKLSQDIYKEKAIELVNDVSKRLAALQESYGQNKV